MKKIQVLSDNFGIYIKDPERVEDVVMQDEFISITINGYKEGIKAKNVEEAREIYQHIVSICYPKSDTTYRQVAKAGLIGKQIEDLLGSRNSKA